MNCSFFEEFQLPGIVGCIDCTHIAIATPQFINMGYPANVFMNRKGFYSLNCQLVSIAFFINFLGFNYYYFFKVCDVNCKILAVDSRFPGSVHDAAIFTMSSIKNSLHRNFIRGDENTYLLGDAGYPLLPYLLTPIHGAAPHTREGRYTHQHSQIRNRVERTFGLLKGVWRCLNPHRVLHYQPEFAARIIYACATLHNIMLNRNIEGMQLMFLIDAFCTYFFFSERRSPDC